MRKMNLEENVHRQNGRFMRRMIETAPQDGKFVILEEDARGNYDVARWSSEVGGWVGEDGEPINITPTHWHPTQGENHLQQGLDFSFFLRRAAEQRATAGDVLAACSVAADPVTRAEVGAQTTLVEAKRVSQARWRFAATVLAASLVAAAFTGMYFRAQVTYEVAQLRKVADAKAAELQQERDHSAALASELATVRRDFETTAALSSKAADEGAQLRKVADARAAELQQERDHSAALASELATVRRDFETTAALSSKAGRKVAEAKAELKQEPDRTASLQGRAPAAGAPVAAPPARKFDPDELATLMNRAKILVAAGDISPARLLLERAAEAQEPTAALMLARTYDPDVLRTENVRNIIPDPALARIWYQRAAQLGSADAQRRLSQWEN
jgi:TPR repeat protein